jgi:hypothetical protein
MSEFDPWVLGLEKLHVSLADGETVFERHEARYLDIAQRVGGQTLLMMIPDGVDPDDWGGRVSDFVDLVFSRLISSGRGMEIIYAGRSAADGTGQSVQVTYADVLEWVKAGVENGGKDKTAIENTRNRSDEQIAYDVNTALRQQRLGLGNTDYTAITERLERWVESRVLAGDFPDMLEAVLDAWAYALDAAMGRDFMAWVIKAGRKSF